MNRILFASGLNLLHELDESLEHGSDDVWPPDVALRRNTMVWQVAHDALENGYPAYISDEENWPVIYIELPTGQVSWHVPTNEAPPGCYLIVRNRPSEDLWDGHTREEKAKRITEYLETAHYPRSR